MCQPKNNGSIKDDLSLFSTILNAIQNFKSRIVMKHLHQENNIIFSILITIYNLEAKN